MGIGVPKTGILFISALSSQKVLSGSGRAGRLRLMGKYIDHRLVARPEPDNTFWDDTSTLLLKQESAPSES